MTAQGLLLWSATGCFANRSVEPLPTVAEWEHVRVTRIVGEALELDAPRIERDSLIGMQVIDGTQHRVAIAASNIQAVQVRQFQTGRTIGLITAVYVGVLGFYLIGLLIALGGAST